MQKYRREDEGEIGAALVVVGLAGDRGRHQKALLSRSSREKTTGDGHQGTSMPVG
jgi:hypothetical protein